MVRVDDVKFMLTDFLKNCYSWTVVTIFFPAHAAVAAVFRVTARNQLDDRLLSRKLTPRLLAC